MLWEDVPWTVNSDVSEGAAVNNEEPESSTKTNILTRGSCDGKKAGISRRG